MKQAPSNDALQLLHDKMALQELVLTYCRAADRRDYALLRSLYTADAIDDHGEYFCGPAGAYVDWLPTVLETWESTLHCVMNSLFKVDGDRAEGEIYKVAYHRSRPPDQYEVTSGGRFLDRYERHDGVWKFSYRRIVQDFKFKAAMPVVGGAPAAQGGDMGVPGAGDLLYSHLSMFRRGMR